MQKSTKILFATLIPTLLVSNTYASEQSDAKGFIEDANGSVLFRTGLNTRDKKNGKADQNSAGQSAIFKLDSGFTQGTIGFGAGILTDGGFKIGNNFNAGPDMIPAENQGKTDEFGHVTPKDHWLRGGGYIKARVSNTTLVYGTQLVNSPVFASNLGRLAPEYYEGLSITSHEINNLELSAGKYTKNVRSGQVGSDANNLDKAITWGAKYKINEQLNASYYGLDIKDRLKRHYVNTNFKQSLSNDRSLTYDLNGYHTKWDPDGNTYSETTNDKNDRANTIWSISATYNTGPHNVMLAYQQNIGNTGYDYNNNGDGGASIALPNSYLSDFAGAGEKSVNLQYTFDFSAFNIPGLTWTSAYVYGWDINVANADRTKLITSSAKETEFFNQIKYTVQSGFAKDVSFRARNYIYRADEAYRDNYMPNTNEWRIFLDIPITLF
ncbi:OprD family outer membrane porin [Acinetobacter portensis]|uniref:OprD family outer membrane porin n=1 Tax=Acinetobacter portensis TaxID=1839785 RepID=UPI0013D5A29E|nr:OprD family outer membrane porin [Acinetobacter portensis]